MKKSELTDTQEVILINLVETPDKKKIFSTTHVLVEGKWQDSFCSNAFDQEYSLDMVERIIKVSEGIIVVDFKDGSSYIYKGELEF